VTARPKTLILTEREVAVRRFCNRSRQFARAWTWLRLRRLLTGNDDRGGLHHRVMEYTNC
jgi:hypothetical protein